ncbi:MAG: hypothetical protein ACYC9S_13965 [Leptospirales bacterium]
MTSLVEEIPDSDPVHRWIFAPRMWNTIQDHLIWEGVWEFKRDHHCCESVVWSRHASSRKVHELGKEQEKRKLEEKPGRDILYVGYLSGISGKIRSFRSARGHGLIVRHEPGEGIHHVHLCYQKADGVDLTKNDRSELKLKLKDFFPETSFQRSSALS